MCALLGWLQLQCIQEDRSRNSSSTAGQKTPSSQDKEAHRIPRQVKLERTTNQGKDDDSDCGVSRLSDVDDSSRRGAAKPEFPRHSSQGGLVSLPSINEPKHFATPVTCSQDHRDDKQETRLSSGTPQARRMNSQEERECMISMAKQLDENDRQAKRRTISGNDNCTAVIEATCTTPAEHVGRRRTSSIGSSGTVAISTSQQQHAMLKEQVLMQLDRKVTGEPFSQDASSGQLEMQPGAYLVAGGPGGPASYSSSGNSGDRQQQRQEGIVSATDCNNKCHIRDGHLIEAYLVAQQNSTAQRDATTTREGIKIENKRSALLSMLGAPERFPKSFWNMSEAQFLNALNTVILNRRPAS